ncbi:MAG: DUF1573 domain-containing protein [Thermoflexibacter sp.]
MKKLHFCFVFVLFGIFTLIHSAFAQIEFKKVTHQFGEVLESGGEVSIDFEYVNGFKPTKIVMVQPSCGCTTPDWSKETINPQEKGKITVKFAPKGRWGEFSKTVTVMTDHNQVFWLKIEGEVVEKKSKKEGSGE